MYFWNKFPFLRFSIALSAGVLAGYHHVILGTKLWQVFVLTAACVYFVLYGYYIISGRKKIFKPWLGTAAVVSLFVFGNYIMCMHNNANVISLQSFSAERQTAKAYTGIIVSAAEEKQSNYQYELKLDKGLFGKKWRRIQGKTLLLVTKSSSPTLKYGQEIYVHAKLEEVAVPVNSWDFDYKRYLSNQKICFISYTSNVKIRLLHSYKLNPIQSFAIRLRQTCEGILRTYIPGKGEQIITAALLLGTRTNLSSELKTAYTNAGISHVLAVSGFHVLLIYGTIVFCFGWLKKFPSGNILLCILSLGLIWFYGMVTGLTPSVVRAVVMCSFVIFGNLLKRRTNIYNTLAASAFFLICFDPLLLVNAGFLLSYAAVLGIVTIHPKIYHLFYFNAWIGRKLWEMASVTLAAQLATLPLLLFYFHQFPVLFLPVNLVAVPLTTFVLYASGLLVGAASAAPESFLIILGSGIHYLLHALHVVLLYLQNLPKTLVTNINITILEVVMLYCILGTITAFLAYKKLWIFQVMAFQVAIFCGAILMSKYRLNNQQMVVLYQMDNAPLVVLVESRHMTLLTENVSAASFISQRYAPHLAMLGIKKINTIDRIKAKTLALKVHKNFKYLVWQQHKILMTEKIKADMNLPRCDALVVGDYNSLNRKCNAKSVIIAASVNRYNRMINHLKKNKVVLPIHNLTLQGVLVKKI